MTDPNTTDLAPSTPNEIAPAGTGGLDMQALMQSALQQGPDGVAALERLCDLNERMVAQQAASAFAAARARFRARLKPIPHDRKPGASKSGGLKFPYASLPQIARHVDPLLADEGLSYSWESEIAETKVHVTCVLRHELGHCERATVTLPVEADLPANATNATQRAGGALTYGQRYSLIAVLGITTATEDTDGRSSTRPPETITPEQAIELDELFEAIRERSPEAEKAMREKILAKDGVAKVSALPRTSFAAIRQALVARLERAS